MVRVSPTLIQDDRRDWVEASGGEQPLTEFPKIVVVISLFLAYSSPLTGVSIRC